MEYDYLWNSVETEKLQQGIETLFPRYQFSFGEMAQRLLEGDILGTLTDLVQMTIQELTGNTLAFRQVFVWLLILGILSALMNHFVEVFHKNQVADLSFYFMYLLMSAILLKTFVVVWQSANVTLDYITQFGRLLMPVYLSAVALATGSMTAGAYYQLLLVLLYVIESVLKGVLMPLLSTYCLLIIVNGIWEEERLSMVIDLLDKCLNAFLKGAVWIVTGIGIFQSILTPVVDMVKNTTLEKFAGAIPGIGNTAQGVVGLALGSALIVKNSIGAVLLVLLLFLCSSPLLQLLVTALVLKLAAALMGIVSDKRITSCTNHIGNCVLLLVKITGTAMLMLWVTIAVVAVTTNGGR